MCCEDARDLRRGGTGGDGESGYFAILCRRRTARCGLVLRSSRRFPIFFVSKSRTGNRGARRSQAVDDGVAGASPMFWRLSAAKR